ncbi:MAG: 3'-5' exonuclease [Actinomycetota bacterium]
MPLPDFAVVDLETSGFSERRHRILQIGLVLVGADGTIRDRWSTLVALRWPMSSVGPTEVHGITRTMLRDAPALDAVLDELGDRLDGAVLTAHNARFDGAFLARATRRRAPDDPIRSAVISPICTLRMSRRLDPGRERSHRLGDLADHYGVPFEHAHDALADAEATARLLPHLLVGHGITELEHLDRFRVDPASRRRRSRWRRTPRATAGTSTTGGAAAQER